MATCEGEGEGDGDGEGENEGEGEGEGEDEGGGEGEGEGEGEGDYHAPAPAFVPLAVRLRWCRGRCVARLTRTHSVGATAHTHAPPEKVPGGVTK